MEKGLMNEFIGAERVDEATLILDVSDEVLENAAGSVRQKAGAMTRSLSAPVSTVAQVVCGLRAVEQVIGLLFFSQTVELI